MATAAAVSGVITDVRNFPHLGTEEEGPRSVSNLLSNVFTNERYVLPGAVVSSSAPYQTNKGASANNYDKGGAKPAGLPKFNILAGITTRVQYPNANHPKMWVAPVVFDCGCHPVAPT